MIVIAFQKHNIFYLADEFYKNVHYAIKQGKIMKEDWIISS